MDNSNPGAPIDLNLDPSLITASDSVPVSTVPPEPTQDPANSGIIDITPSDHTQEQVSPTQSITEPAPEPFTVPAPASESVTPPLQEMSDISASLPTPPVLSPQTLPDLPGFATSPTPTGQDIVANINQQPQPTPVTETPATEVQPTPQTPSQSRTRSSLFEDPDLVKLAK